MNKDKEKILKYLSELMDEEERKIFEQELKESGELRKLLEAVKKQVEELKTYETVQTDDIYFQNLIPKTRQRIESKRKPALSKIAFAFSTLAVAALIILLQFPGNVENNGNHFRLESYFSDFQNDLSDVDSSEVYGLLASNFIYDYTYYQSGSFKDDMPEAADEILASDFSLENSTYILNETGTSDILDELTDEQINSIYEELLNKKIL